MKEKIPLIIISGPTASGKTALAVELAEIFKGEIISADSMQVYKDVDIATAKPEKKELKKVKHYLISVVNINSKKEFSAYDFVEKSDKIIEKIVKKGKIPFVVGGTGLYIRSLIYGLSSAPGRNPEIRKLIDNMISEKGLSEVYKYLQKVDNEYAEKISANDKVRIKRALEVYFLTGKPLSYFFKSQNQKRRYNPLWLAINVERKELYDRINKRVLRMIEKGLVEEIKKIVEKKNINNNIVNKIIGYREIKDYLSGKKELKEAIKEIQKRTRNYAKRQITWLKKEKDIIWISTEKKNKIKLLIKNYLTKKEE